MTERENSWASSPFPFARRYARHFGGAVGTLLTMLVVTPAAAQSPQWGNLPAGRYAAGFRLVETWDRGRSEKPIADFAGRRDSSTFGVPMQLGIWYPASRSAAVRAMPYFAMALAVQHREQFAPRRAADSADTRREVAQIVAMSGSDTAQRTAHVARTLTQATASIRNAAPARGSFPVAIIATGGWLGVTTVLAEYLASHGWIVVATAGQTRQSGGWQASEPALAVDVGVRAIEFAVAQAHTLPGADLQRLALVGVNFDSFSALEYQARYMRASAVVTINGWETIEDRADVLRSSSWFDPTRIRVPLLNVHWDEPQSAPVNRSHLERLKYADRRSLIIGGLDHAGLVLNPMAVASVTDQKRAAYQYLVRGVQATLSRSIGESSDAFFGRTPAELGLAGVVIKDQWVRPALPAVPTRAEFFEIIGNQYDITRATRLFHEARGRDSTVQLFSEGDMNLATFRLQRLNRLADAIAVQQLAVEAYPSSHLARNALGNARLAAADTSGAIRDFESALAWLGTNATLTPAEKENQARTWRTKLARLRREGPPER